MDVFSLRDSVVGEYRDFATSFTTIRAEDIRAQVDAIYAQVRFWPDPLIQINPNYKCGASLEALASCIVRRSMASRCWMNGFASPGKSTPPARAHGSRRSASKVALLGSSSARLARRIRLTVSKVSGRRPRSPSRHRG
jgi:hypothetical protein